MRITLKDFQEEAVTKLVRHMRGASRDSLSGDLQAVCLSSTTGSGKTVMLTRAIEILFQGDDQNSPLVDATFLWITDQPELNEQTRKKMLSSSSLLSTETLQVLDTSFDQEVLDPGIVYFLNTQKLGKDKGLVVRGDKRSFTVWETIKNSIDARRGKFFVVIDEAHRGMFEENGLEDPSTIIQKFIKGSSGELPAMPIIVGISATPERFNHLIVGTGRMNRPIDVDVEDVRASGLIKDTIILYHPKEEHPTDMTMLREAARSLKRCSAQWSAYCAAEDEPDIRPLLVVQVADSPAKGQVSETDIPQAVSLLRHELGNLANDEFAHAFQEGNSIMVGGEPIRYLAPSEIDGDPDVRVVFFKTSLNTGWDCPRAEVMMSFRAAADATSIAQLVGRMVRTPLARRVIDNEALNAVSLFLPHYDGKALQRVINKLSKPDDGSLSVPVEISDSVVDLHRAPGSDGYFSALAALPSYVIPRRRYSNQVRRLMKLARLLTNDGINDDAHASAKDTLLSVLNDEYVRVSATKRFNDIVNARSQIEIEAVNWDVGFQSTRDGGTVKVDIATENVEDLFEAAGRKLGEGIHKAWWRDHVVKSAADRERAKLELFALCVDPGVVRRLERKAQEVVQDWLKKFKAEIALLDEGSRVAYDEVRNLAASPELVTLVYPAATQSRQSDDRWKKHLYVDEDGVFPATLNSAERDVVERELASNDVVGWLRNVDRKPWSLCIPYDVSGEDRAMFPDFLFLRKEAGNIVVDLVEPHTISLADAPAKAAGLAKFAAQHSERFGRIELILIDGTSAKRFDLTDEHVRKKVQAVKVVDQLRQLFSEF